MTIFKRCAGRSNALSATLSALVLIALSQSLSASICGTSAMALASPVEAAAPAQNPFTAEAQWTPVLVSPTFSPRPFAGGEGEWHLVYDVALTNYARHSSDLQKFEILGQGADGTWSVLKTFDQGQIKKNILLLSQSEASSTLAPGVAAVLFVNIDFAGESAISKVKALKNLKHRIVFLGADALGTTKTYDYESAPFAIDDAPPPRIAAPLRGGKWVAIGGYVGTAGHRQALFAIENGLHSAQPFAIDWVRLDKDNYSTWDSAKVSGSAAYGENVHAVGEGKIVGVVNRFEDQPTIKPVGVDRVKWPGGNSIVQDLGNGYFAFYAHLKPGSIKVKEGDSVKSGDVIGCVGNTGNTTGPHLHMHIARNPGVLQADGVPYRFDHFEVLGQVEDMDAFEKADEKGEVQHYVDGRFKGTHHDQLIRDGFVVDFGN